MKRTAIAALLLFGASAPVLGAGYAELNVGIDYYNQERYADAIVWLGKAIDAGDLVSDQLRAAHMDRGLSLLHQEKVRLAIDDFSAALTIAPDDDRAITSRAFAYLAVGDVDHAITDLNAAHDKKPNDTEIDKQMGLADWQLGRYADAHQAFVRLEKRDATAWFWAQLTNVKQNRAVDQVTDAGYDPHQWPNPLKELFMGRLQADAIIKDYADAGEGMACDADFYVGEWLLAHGDNAGARPLLEKVNRECRGVGSESRMAMFELRKMMP